MGTLAIESAAWENTPGYARDIRDRFDLYTCTDLELLEHRTYIEEHGLGMGERAFHWLWRLIVDAMPTYFRFLEVGVYKGQILSLVKLLANRTDRLANVTGVTLLSSFAGDTDEFKPFADVDYGKIISDLHNRYRLRHPRIILGDSTKQATQEIVAEHGPYDVVYIDGCHETPYVTSDLLNYPPMLKPGGLLVVDDASCNLDMPPGFFKGIEPVSQAVRTIIETDPQWEHLLAVVHNRVWRRQCE